MNFSRVLATIALGALAVAVMTASFFLIRSPEPSLASDAVSVDVSQTPEAATAPAQSPQVQTPAAAPVPQVPAGAPVQRAVPPNLGSDDDDDWCDVNAAHRDDDCDDDWDDNGRDDNDDWDDQDDDWDDDIDDGQDD